MYIIYITYVLEEIHELAVVDEIPGIFLLEHLRQKDRQWNLASGCPARTWIDIAVTVRIEPHSAAGAALQFRSRSNEIRAFARDQHDLFLKLFRFAGSL